MTVYTIITYTLRSLRLQILEIRGRVDKTMCSSCSLDANFECGAFTEVLRCGWTVAIPSLAMNNQLLAFGRQRL
jgi:hypothetical protein